MANGFGIADLTEERMPTIVAASGEAVRLSHAFREGVPTVRPRPRGLRPNPLRPAVRARDRCAPVACGTQRRLRLSRHTPCRQSSTIARDRCRVRAPRRAEAPVWACGTHTRRG